MKQFLRYIFLLVAMFMATTNAWGECYLYENQKVTINYDGNGKNDTGTFSSTEYSLVDDNGMFIGGTMTFKYDLSGGTNATNWHKLTIQGYDGNTWQDIWDTGDIHNKDPETANLGNISSWRNYLKIRFKRTAKKESWTDWGKGERDINVTNLYITRIVSISPESASHDFESVEVGKSSSKTFTFTYSNVGTTISATSNSEHFSVSPTAPTFDNCSGTSTLTVTFSPKTSGEFSGQITLTCKDGDTTKKTVLISVSGKGTGAPIHSWNEKTAYNVDETIDLSTWYSSNNDGARSYEIVSFSPLDDTGETPILNGATIQLTRAGELTVRMKQAAHGVYSAKESTQTFTISKHNSNFKWKNPDNLQCYVDEFCGEASLFSRSSDIPLTITSSNPNVVNYQDGIFTAVGAGTAVITVTQAKHYKWTDFTESYTIHVNKYDLSASIVQGEAVWNELIDNPFSLSNGLTDFDVESKNPTIAEYHKDTKKIQTYFTDGTAYFQITRPEDRKYNKLDKTLSLEVKSAGGCDVLTTEKDQEYIVGYHDNYDGFDFDLNGVGNTISLEVQRQTLGSGYIYIIGYDASGNNETDIASIKYDEMSDSEWRLKTYTIANENIRKIKIRSGHNIWDDALNKYFKNVQVTRKTYLRPQIDGDIFYLTQVSSGMQFAGTFPLDWSTCSDEIRFSCDNPNFTIIPSVIDASSGQGTTSIIVTYSANTENPSLTGTLTIYDQSQTKSITLSCEHLIQTIEWPQYFYNLEADENGVINEDITLNAIARAVNGQPTNRPILYTLSVSPANASLSTDANNKTHLNITGMCEGTITASVEGFTDANGRTYSASSLTRQIRIRKAGTPCHSHALYIVDLQTITLTNSTKTFPINGLPENTMTFIAHTDVLSTFNDLSIDFSKDGSTWGNKQTINIKPGYEHSNYSCNVPDSVSYIRFQTSSTLRTFFDMVTIRQKEYLNASVDHIDFPNTIVNQSFSTTFTVDYSDVPYIQYEVTNNHNLNLQLTPSPEINNNCGEYGTYTFTLTGMSPYPQEDIKETITIFTSAGHRVEIPITITAKLSETYYFDQQNGDWSNLSNWRVNGNIPTSHPTPSNPVIINKAATIGTNDATFEGIAYSVTLEDGGSLTVLPQGGLTVHAGGFKGANENNLILHNKKKGAGFIRISPYFTNEMPTIKVLYETTSTLDDGANELAVWQYIGAPGAGCEFTVDYITWLYLWSEAEGWLNKTGKLTLEPFAGYAITQYGKPTYELVAQPINTNKTITLTKTDTGSGMKGDNLFANSFMAPIDVKNFRAEDFEGEVHATFYLFNSGSYSEWADHNNNNNTLGDNHSVSPGQYCAIPALAGQYLSPDFDITTIPPMQGVYVSAKENNAKIHLNYNRHVWNAETVTTDMHEPMRAPSHNVFKPDNFRRLRIQVNSANSGADRMYVIQDTITTADYDNGYDAPNQLADGLANIYTNEHFGQMEVSCSNHIDSTFVGFTAGIDSVYTLRFNAIIGDDLHLYDLDNDSLILLEEDATYTFHATPHSKNDLRFQILLHPEKNLDFGKEEKDELYTDVTDVHTTQVWSHGGCIYINNAPTNTIATLYNISGHKLLTTPIYHTPYTLDLSYLPKGVYMLQLNTQVYKFVIQ